MATYLGIMLQRSIKKNWELNLTLKGKNVVKIWLQYVFSKLLNKNSLLLFRVFKAGLAFCQILLTFSICIGNKVICAFYRYIFLKKYQKHVTKFKKNHIKCKIVYHTKADISVSISFSSLLKAMISINSLFIYPL